MIICSFVTACFLSGCQSNKPTNTNLTVTQPESNEPAKPVQKHKDKEFVTQQGMIRTDGKESTILSFSEETGDVTGFCFKNDSAIGRSLENACKKGDLCEFSGEVDWTETNCPFGNGTFSAQARILSIKSVKKIVK